MRGQHIAIRRLAAVPAGQQQLRAAAWRFLRVRQRTEDGRYASTAACSTIRRQIDVYRRAILSNGNPRFFSVSAVHLRRSFAPAFPNVFAGIPTGFSIPTQDIISVSRTTFRTLLLDANGNFQVSHEIVRNTAVSAGYLFTKGTGLPALPQHQPDSDREQARGWTCDLRRPDASTRDSTTS